MIHIAVLECDTPVDAVQERRGSYGDVFEHLLRQGLGSSQLPLEEGELVVTKWPVVDTQVYPDPNDVDAILLTGSKHNSFDNDPWIVGLTNYVGEVIKLHHQTPVVGICFGHQIIARALGSRVGRNPNGWEVAVSDVNLTEPGKELFGREILSVHQMHRDIVYDLPQDCVNLGSSPQCHIQGFYRPRRLLTVQGHPEFDAFIMDQIVASYRMTVSSWAARFVNSFGIVEEHHDQISQVLYIETSGP